MKRKPVFVIIFLALLLILTTGLTANAHAATVKNTPSPDFYALEKTCTVIYVHLHGTQSPTTTCAQTKAVSGVSPKTEVAKNCSVPGVTMEIEADNDNQQICFIEEGYWGYRVNNVDGVLEPSYGETGTGTNGWFLWYYSGYTSGSYCNINANNYYSASFTGGLTVDITQIDPGAQHGGSVAC